MLRTFSLTTVVILLVALPLSATHAEKTPKTPKTDAQIEKYQRNHQGPQDTPGYERGGSTVSTQPYQRTENRNGPITIGQPYDRDRNYGGSTGAGQPYRRDSDHGGIVVTGPPYNRGGGRDVRYGYPSPNRAYEFPDRRRWDNDRDHRDWDHGHGGWGWSPGWSLGFGLGYGLGYNYGYSYPEPYAYPVPVPYAVPVPEPTYAYPPPAYEYYPPSGGYVAPQNATKPEDLPLLGCDIVAGDKTFLGIIDREYDSPQSIANRNSDFGNPQSRLSIWNPAGPYGSPTGAYSPWNPRCERPPMLIWHGAFKGYLTTNPNIQPAISPDVLSKEIEASPWR